jgi:hypothetical protein
MAYSSTVSPSDTALASQYNNLRKDVLDITGGHDHNGINSKSLPANSVRKNLVMFSGDFPATSFTGVGGLTATPIIISSSGGKLFKKISLWGADVDIQFLDGDSNILTMQNVWENGIDSTGASYQYSQSSITTYNIAFCNYTEIKFFLTGVISAGLFPNFQYYIKNAIQNRSSNYQFVDVVIQFTYSDIRSETTKVKLSANPDGGYFSEEINQSTG